MHVMLDVDVQVVLQSQRGWLHNIHVVVLYC